MLDLVERTQQRLHLHESDAQRITQCYTVLHSVTIWDVTQCYSVTVLHIVLLVLHIVLHNSVTFLMEAELSMGRSKDEQRSCSGLRLNS